MTNPWLRLYNEILDNEKILMLSPEDRWYFIGVLNLKNRGVLDGEQDPDRRDRKVALKLRLLVEEARAVKARLAEEQLVDADSWLPLGWDERQFQSDSSKERTRAYRNRKAKQGRGDQLSESDDVVVDTLNHPSTSVTLSNRHSDNLVTVQETESESDTENTHTTKPKRASASVCVNFNQRKKPGTKSVQSSSKDWQPESWVDSERWHRWRSVLKAKGHALTKAQAQLALESLRRCVFELGWPMSDVMDKAIANGYRQFYPLNRKGEPEKNPCYVKHNRETSQKGEVRDLHHQSLVTIQAELAHWQRIRRQSTSASSQNDLDQLVAQAENKLQQLRAEKPESSAA